MIEKSSAIASAVEIARSVSADGDAISHLRVLSIFKGSLGSEIQVNATDAWHDVHGRFEPARRTPVDDGYTYLLFLMPGERVWRLFLPTASLMYHPIDWGRLVPHPGEMSEFEFGIRRAVALQAVGALEPPESWQADCLALPGPRGHCLTGMLPLGWWIPKNVGKGLQPPFSADALETIANGFAKSPRADDSLPQMLWILRGYQDSAVDRAAADALETAMYPSKLDDSGNMQPWKQLGGERPELWTASAYVLLAERLGEDPALVAEGWAGTRSGFPTTRHLRKEWDALQARYQLAPTRVAEPPYWHTDPSWIDLDW